MGNRDTSGQGKRAEKSAQMVRSLPFGQGSAKLKDQLHHVDPHIPKEQQPEHEILTHMPHSDTSSK
jgi:hypothetical protein